MVAFDLDWRIQTGQGGAGLNSCRDRNVIESRLAENAVVAADNVGIGGQAMDDYLSLVRSRYESSTHWFETDLPWAPRDAMEVTRFRAGKFHSPKHR